jgi:YNFM family putative membrane transporter
VGAVFLLYILGSIGSAMFGARAGKRGHASAFRLPVALMLAGAALTLAQPLWAFIAAMGLLTFGFFGAHAIGSAWVGRVAGERRAQGAALYLMAYYTGSSVLGSAGGLLWERAGWAGVAALVIALVGAALLVGLHLRRLQPQDHVPAPGPALAHAPASAPAPVASVP